MKKTLAAAVAAALVSPTAHAAPWTQDLESPPPMRPGALVVDNVCPEDPRWPTAEQAAGRDVKVTLPRDRTCQPPKVPGGQIISMLGGTPENPAKNAHVVGGEIVNVHPQGPLTGVRGQALLRLHNISGTALVEGVKFDARATCQDIINSLAMRPGARVVLQNIYAEGAGTCGAGGTHGDVFHAQGSGAQHELVVQNMTARVLGQGIFVPPRPPGNPAGHGVHTLTLDHVHLIADDPKRQPSKKHGIGWALFWNEGLAGSKPAKATFREVYLDGHFPYASRPAASGFHNDCAILPAGSADGTWCKGKPREGSPVRPEMVGRNYNRTAFTGVANMPPDLPKPPPPPPPPSGERINIQGSGLLINAGGAGDQWAIGGRTVDRGPIEIAGAPGREALYRTERWGMGGYSLPLTPGTYDVHLHFAETWFTTAGRRPMDITVGEVKLPTFDVFETAGADRAAVVKDVLGVKVGAQGLPITWANPATSMINAIEVTLPGALVDGDTPPPPPPPTPPPPVTSRDCDAAAAPAHAKAAGLTRLAFCEDFSDPKRISLTTELKPGQTFAQVGAGNPKFGGARVMPESAFRFAPGVMSVEPTHNNYQANFISATPDGTGFLMRGDRWATEIRWKHADCRKTSGFPAFWSMDSRHWFTPTAGRVFLEPDFYENIGGDFIGAIHHWKASDKEFHGIEMTRKPMASPEQFFVAGSMSLPGRYSWWLNGSKMGEVAPKWLDLMADFRGPVMFGSGPGCGYTVDYVRVWTAP